MEPVSTVEAMKLKETAIVLGILGAFFLSGYLLGRCTAGHSKETAAKPETGILTAERLQPVEITEPEDILFANPEPKPETKVMPKRKGIAVQESGNKQERALSDIPPARPVQPGDDTLKYALATVRDWNRERVYRGTLFNNARSGTLTYHAAVQYNALKALEYDFVPAPVTVKRNRLRPYLRGQIDTRGTYGVSVGALYRWFGADVGIVRYDRNKYAISVGVMIIF